VVDAAHHANAARSSKPAAKPTKSSTYLEGIDVSHWQGTIDWTRVATKERFAIAKATEGQTYTDPTYATNRSAARGAGVTWGAYHYAQPDLTANDAVLEADHYVDTALLGSGDLRPALDLEVSNGLSTADLVAWVQAWVERVRSRVGAAPMIYTNPSFWQNHMGNTTWFADNGYALWIANWGVSKPSVPASNWGGKGWTFWQYSSTGSVPGISGDVDLDRFNGTSLSSATL
jgi:lysozyme